MSHAMLNVDTIARAAERALNNDLDPQDLEGLNVLTRLNLLAALAVAARHETPPVMTMAITPDDFALLSSEWAAARDTVDDRGPTGLPRPQLVPGDRSA